MGRVRTKPELTGDVRHLTRIASLTVFTVLLIVIILQWHRDDLDNLSARVQLLEKRRRLYDKLDPVEPKEEEAS